MPNPLDEVTQDRRDDSGNPLRRVYIDTGDAPVAQGTGAGNALTQSMQPAAAEAVPWTIEDLQRGVEAIKQYVAGNVAPVNDMAKRFINYDRQFTQDVLNAPATIWQNPGKANEAGQRFMGGENWLSNMVRSATTSPGKALASETPVTSEEMVAPAQDIAGMATGSMLFGRPGAGTLGSGPVRPPGMPKMRDMIGEDEWNKLSPREQATLRDAELKHEGAHDYNNIKTEEQADAAFEAGHLTDDEYEAVLGKIVARSRGIKLHADSQPGTAVSALAQSAKGPAPVFYSALEHAATNAAQETMSPQQWLGFLKNTPGVKSEELAWTGLPEWLGAQKGKVSKKDVQNYLDEHKVEIKDVTKEGPKAYEDLTPAELERVKEDYRETNGMEYDEPVIWDDVRNHYDEMLEEGGSSGDVVTKYSSYQLPGGENYREHLLTMPNKTKEQLQARYEQTAKKVDKLEAKLIKEFKKDNGIEPGAPITMAQNVAINDLLKAHPELSQLKSEAMDLAKQTHVDTMGYRSSHWDEPNVLAHVRTNDRTMQVDAPQFKLRNKTSGNTTKAFDSEEAALAHRETLPEKLRPNLEVVKAGDTKPVKSLHIEEIQSDWHQQGRKQGYKGDAPSLDDVIKLEKKANVTYQKLLSMVQEAQPSLKKESVRSMTSELTENARAGEPLGSFHTKEEKALATQWADEWKAYKDAHEAQSQAYSKVSDAPFKTTWPELALKRMIRKAAEEGYDRISWTPGEAQAARYDLSKIVNNIDVKPLENGNRTVSVNVRSGVHASAEVDPNGVIVKGYDAMKDGVGKNLADFIGKDVADKVVNSPKLEIREYKGPELKGFTLEKDGKKLNATYDTEAAANKARDETSGSYPVHVVPEDRPEFLAKLSKKATPGSQAKFEIVDESGARKGLAETREQADKLVKLHSYKLEGENLKVGGEGMREFYDKMLPKMVEKIGKAHGVKVKQTPIEGTISSAERAVQLQKEMDDFRRDNVPPYVKDKGFDTLEGLLHNIKNEDLKEEARVAAWKFWNKKSEFKAMDREMEGLARGPSTVKSGETHMVHYFDLPQSLKEHAIGKGFPLYMSGVPFPLTPVDYDPFAKKERK